MKSYEQRLDTFTNKKWPIDEYKSSQPLLAICGFICDNSGSEIGVKCVYCKKRLEGWEKEDVPIIEHYTHKKTCILFNPHILKNRVALLGDITQAKDLAKKGFVRIDLKSDTPFIFCYKCGSTNLEHICAIKGRWTVDLKNSEYFIIKLLRGDYLDLITNYTESILRIPTKYKILLNQFLVQALPFETIDEVLSKIVKNAVQKLETVINEDINKLT